MGRPGVVSLMTKMPAEAATSFLIGCHLSGSAGRGGEGERDRIRIRSYKQRGRALQGREERTKTRLSRPSFT